MSEPSALRKTGQREYSLAHLTVPGMSPPAMVELAARCGYDHVGFRFTQVTPGGWVFPLQDDAPLKRATQAALAATGLGVLDIEVARLTPEVRVADFAPLLATAAEIGARHVLTQIHDDERARAAANYEEFCDLAAPFGLTADLEFLPWTHNRSLATAAAYVGLAGRANAGVMIDTLHFDRSNSNPADLAAMPAEWFRYVQLCDAPTQRPATLEGLLHTAREARLDPGEGGIQLTDILRHLPPGLPISLEVPNTEREQNQSPEQRLTRMLSAARSLVKAAEPAVA